MLSENEENSKDKRKLDAGYLLRNEQCSYILTAMSVETTETG